MSEKSYLQSKVKKGSDAYNKLVYYRWLKEIGMQIADLREGLDYTQTGLANKLSVPQSVIARIEAGHNMTCETLFKLSKALDEDICIFNASIEAEKEGVNKYYKAPEGLENQIFVVGYSEFKSEYTTSNHIKPFNGQYKYATA